MKSSGDIIAKTIHLMHAFVQDGHNTDVAVTERAPIDIMMFAPRVIALDAELRVYRAPSYFAFGNPVEAFKESADISFGLRAAPRLERVGINLVEPLAGDNGNPKSRHGQRWRARAKTASASRAA